MAASRADFISGEDLEAILPLIETDSFDKLRESRSMVAETSFEMQVEEPVVHLHTESSKTSKTLRGLQRHFSSKHNKKYLHTFDHKVICSLKQLIQLSVLL